MVVVMKERASDTEVEAVIAQLVEFGMDVHRSTGASRIVLGVVGGGKVDPRLIELMAGVHEVVRITQPYKLASRTFQQEDTIITIGDLRIGGDEVIVIAGPVLRGERSAGACDRRGGQARRREGAARRRLQAALVTVQLPGHGRGRVCSCCAKARMPTTSSSSPR